MMDKKISLSQKLYIIISTAFLALLCCIMIAPLLKVVAESLSARQFIETNSVLFWPKGFNMESYGKVFADKSILNAFKNSVIVTCVGTFINLFLTALLAYPLSRGEYLFKKQVLLMVTITMIFSAPMIPSYLLVRYLGIDNTLLAVIIPGAISGFNFYVMRSFFMGLPGELIDSARIDGCSEMQILLKIVLPLSKAALATLGLFYGVGHWNELQGPLIYLRKPAIQTLQIKLNSILQEQNTDSIDLGQINFSPVTIKMTTIVVATVPILVIYPFLQKYFVTGATLGSIKE